jgi:hypothetical protein
MSSLADQADSAKRIRSTSRVLQGRSRLIDAGRLQRGFSSLTLEESTGQIVSNASKSLSGASRLIAWAASKGEERLREVPRPTVVVCGNGAFAVWSIFNRNQWGLLRSLRFQAKSLSATTNTRTTERPVIVLHTTIGGFQCHEYAANTAETLIETTAIKMTQSKRRRRCFQNRSSIKTVMPNVERTPQRSAPGICGILPIVLSV